MVSQLRGLGTPAVCVYMYACMVHTCVCACMHALCATTIGQSSIYWEGGWVGGWESFPQTSAPPRYLSYTYTNAESHSTTAHK